MRLFEIGVDRRQMGILGLLRQEGAGDTVAREQADLIAGQVACGGDGTIRKLTGCDMRWQLASEARVDGRVTSLGLVHGGAELLVGTDAGLTYRLLCEDMSRRRAGAVSADVRGTVLVRAHGGGRVGADEQKGGR